VFFYDITKRTRKGYVSLEAQNMKSSSAPQQWFRTYAEIINDPKLLLIAPSDRWYFVGILAMKCSAVLDKTPPEKLDRVICQQLRLTSDEWQECSRRLKEEGLIDSDYQPINWNKRQFKSDTSAARTREYRERKSLERVCDVTVTPPETETETETDKKNTSSFKKDSRVPVAKIIDLYHEKLPKLPIVQKITSARRGNIKQRWREDLPKLDNWENFFDYVGQSDFLMGRVEGRNGGKPFMASLEWITKSANYTKILEGNYHGV